MDMFIRLVLLVGINFYCSHEMVQVFEWRSGVGDSFITLIKIVEIDNPVLLFYLVVSFFLSICLGIGHASRR